MRVSATARAGGLSDAFRLAITEGGMVPTTGVDPAFGPSSLVPATAARVRPRFGLKRASTLRALEHRLLFDGAGAVSLPPGIVHPDQVSLPEAASIRFDLAPGASQSAGHAPSLSITDADASDGVYRVQLEVPAGTLHLDVGAGLDISGNGGSTLQLSGRLSDINQALPSLLFTAAPGISGVSKLAIQVTDPQEQAALAKVALDITPVNHAPDAIDDSRAFFANTGPITGNLITGASPGDGADSDPDQDALRIVGVASGYLDPPITGSGATVAGQYGSLTLASDGSYTYTPGPAGFDVPVWTNLYEIFAYTVMDTNGATDTAYLYVTLCGPSGNNQPPQALSDARHVVAGERISDGQAIVGGPSGDRTDVDPEGGPLKVEAVGSGQLGRNAPGLLPAHVGQTLLGDYGSLTMQRDGAYVYQTDARAASLQPGQAVSDTFTYAISDAQGAGAVSTVTVWVLALSPTGPQARPDLRAIDEPARISGPGRVRVDGDVVRGGKAGEQADVLPPEDDHVHLQGVVAGISGGPLNSIVNGSLQGTVSGSYGTLVMDETGRYCYLPDERAQCLGPDDQVSDIFSYTIVDDFGRSSTTTLTIHIQGLNQAPQALPDVNSILASASLPTHGNVLRGASGLGGSAGDRADNDPDACDLIQVCATTAGAASAGTVAVEQVGRTIQGQHGALVLQADGAYTYQVDTRDAAVIALAPGALLHDTFTYTIRDTWGALASTTLDIRIIGVNDAPSAPVETRTIMAGALAGTAQSQVRDIPLPTDPDRPPQGLQVIVTALPEAANGRFLLADGEPLKVGDVLPASQLQQLQFVPAAALQGAPGPDGLIPAGRMRFWVDDGQGGRTEGAIAINIQPLASTYPGPSPMPPTRPGPDLPLARLPGLEPGVPSPLPMAPAAFDPFAGAGSRLAELRLSDAQGTLRADPVAASPASAVAPDKPLKRDDDCIEPPLAAKAASARDAQRLKPRAVVSPRPALSELSPGSKRNFSESLKHAAKRFKPPARVAPPPPAQKIC